MKPETSEKPKSKWHKFSSYQIWVIAMASKPGRYILSSFYYNHQIVSDVAGNHVINFRKTTLRKLVDLGVLVQDAKQLNKYTVKENCKIRI